MVHNLFCLCSVKKVIWSDFYKCTFSVRVSERAGITRWAFERSSFDWYFHIFKDTLKEEVVRMTLTPWLKQGSFWEIIELEEIRNLSFCPYFDCNPLEQFFCIHGVDLIFWRSQSEEESEDEYEPKPKKGRPKGAKHGSKEIKVRSLLLFITMIRLMYKI